MYFAQPDTFGRADHAGCQLAKAETRPAAEVQIATPKGSVKPLEHVLRCHGCTCPACGILYHEFRYVYSILLLIYTYESNDGYICIVVK